MSALTAPQARRRRGRILTLLAAALAPLLAGIFLLPASPAQAATHQVKIQQYAYGPASLNIEQGDTVTWTNLDSVGHDVVVTQGPASFRSPMLDKGESWSHTFTTAGSYSYICSVHPDMRASVTVAAAPVASAPAASAPAATAPTTHVSHAAEGGQAVAPTPAASAPAVAAPAPAAPTPAAVPATATSTLNPLLLVAGASIAVVVFCLLLMASRPAYPPTPEPVSEPKPTDKKDKDKDAEPDDVTQTIEPVGASAARPGS